MSEEIDRDKLLLLFMMQQIAEAQQQQDREKENKGKKKVGTLEKSPTGLPLPQFVPSKDCPECQRCNKVFRFYIRKHHCRHCGYVVCNTCSKNRIPLPAYRLKHPVRVCDHCFSKVCKDGVCDRGALEKDDDEEEDESKKVDLLKDWGTLFGDSLVDSDGKAVNCDELSQKPVIGIYFGCGWCPYSRDFTEALKPAYLDHLKDKQMEVVFISRDRSESTFNVTVQNMPWLRVPYAKRDVAEALDRFFDVRGYPTFILLDNNRKLITTEGRRVIAEDAQGENFPWKLSLVNPFCFYTYDRLNESPCLFVMVDEGEEISAGLKTAVTEAAKKYQNEVKKEVEDMDLTFFIAQENEGNSEVLKRMKSMLSYEQQSRVVILDGSKRGAFYSPKMKTVKDITKERITEFIAQHKAGKLERTGLVMNEDTDDS